MKTPQEFASQSNKALHLLSAIVHGDASVNDIAAELKRDGINSLEDAISLLRAGMRDRLADQNAAETLINLKSMRQKPGPNSRCQDYSCGTKSPIFVKRHNVRSRGYSAL